MMLFVFGMFLTVSVFGQPNSKGNLVIVGGGLEDDNRSIYEPLLAMAGGAEMARMAVIPSASGVPLQSYVSFRNILIGYGVRPENIHLIPIAMIDDDSTALEDESVWKMNGDNPELAGMIRTCNGVWFTGGDQSRTIKTLVRADGSQTLVLEAVWEVYMEGGFVGGSSAGAAIMSGSMIGGGNSLAALEHGIITGYQGDDFPEGDGLLMLNGLGFFPHGIVDQHFDARARIGRLAVALMDERFGGRWGFGIDENTALIYIGEQNICQVAGASGVTILDTKNARISNLGGLPCIENLTVSYLQQGDTFDCTTGTIQPDESKKPTRGNEYYTIPNPGQAGILSGNTSTFRELVTVNLIDNKASDTVRNISFSSENAGFLVELVKTIASQGYYAEQPYDDEKYTVTNIRMDIRPVQINVLPLKP
jgi:cyanophycinase